MVDKHIDGLAAFIEHYLEAKGISARELAIKADLSASYIYNILKRKNFQPTVESLARLARAMNISSGDLLRASGYIDTDGEQSIWSTSELVHAIPEKYRHLFSGKNERYIQFAEEMAKHEVDPKYLEKVLRAFLDVTEL